MSVYITPQMIDPASDRGGGDQNNGLFGRLFGYAIRKWRRRKMIAALEAMDDRTLRDIGIYRGDISRVVDGFDCRELRMVPFAPASKPVETGCEQFQRMA